MFLKSTLSTWKAQKVYMRFGLNREGIFTESFLSSIKEIWWFLEMVFKRKRRRHQGKNWIKHLKLWRNTSMKTKGNVTTLDQILDKKYGKRGELKREEWEQQFEAFRIGVLIEQARTKLGMTQEELAEKCGTNKSYISRIENNSSDIRLSTLMKIIQQGLGGQLKLTLQL